MKLCELCDGLNNFYKKMFWIFVYLLLSLVLSCSNSNTTNDEGDSNGVVIPALISSLISPPDTTEFTAKLYLDDGIRPIATSNISTDGTQKTVDFSNINVPVGTHTLTVQFTLVTNSYGLLLLAKVTSDPIEVSVESTQSVNIDVSNYIYPDKDDDSISNLDEIIQGTDPTANEAHTVSSIELSISSPANMDLNQYVDMKFNYETNYSAGVLILVRPYVAGSAAANYSVCESPIYAVGKGSGTCFFTIIADAITVDEIEVKMWTAGQSELLYEKFIPVLYQYSVLEHSISNVQFTPTTPMSLANGDNISITFDYKTTEAGGVRIRARPLSSSALSPNFAASGSVLNPAGAGSGDQFITITAGAVLVDQVRFEMWAEYSTTLLQQYFYNVEYSFGGANITSVTESNDSLIRKNSSIDFDE